MTGKGPILLLLPAIAAGAILATNRGADAQTSEPLTKEQYFQQSLQVYTVAARANGLFYDVAVNPHRTGECTRKVRLMARFTGKATAIAAAVTPPAEIADTHSRLVRAGDRLARGFRHVAKRVRAGKLVCGNDSAGGKLQDQYYRSGIDELEAKLMDLGYVPSGY